MDNNYQEDKILLLERGKKGVLNVIFGRTSLIVVMLLIQIVLIASAFNHFASFVP